MPAVSPAPRTRHEGRRYAVGSILFALGATPGYIGLVSPTVDAATYFIGSIFFTWAATMQLRDVRAMRAGRLDLWADAILWVGTLCFNASTIFAIAQNLTAAQENRFVWRPDAVGSALFLVSSILAVVAISRSAATWAPHVRDWRIAWWNLLGSVAFGISALGAYVVPSSGEVANANLANLGTFLGALCFLWASLQLEGHRAVVADRGG